MILGQIHQRLILWQSRPFLCLVCSLCLCLAFSSPKKFNTPYLMCSLCLGSFLQINLHSVFVVFVVFEIIFPKKSCPVLICLTCLMCLMCLTFSCCVWCGFFLLHLKCVHFPSLKLSPSSSVFDVFNLCFGSFFLKIFYTLFLTCSMCFRIFPKKFLPCSHVSNVFDVFCVLFCVSCVFLSSLFFLFSKKFAPRIWRVWCVSDSSTCLSWMYFVSHVFFFCCLPS